MKTKSIFNLALKIFGIYFYAKIVLLLPQLVAAVIMLFDHSDAMSMLIVSVSTIGTFAVYFFLGWLLTMKSASLTEYLIKEDENTDVAFPPFAILSIAVIVIGGLLVINELPVFISQLGAKFSQPQFDSRSFDLLASVVKIAIGCWMVYAHGWIAEKISKAN